MKVDMNPFPKLVDVDMITIDWTRKGEQEGIEKMNRDVSLTKVVHFVGLRLGPSIVRRALNMAKNWKTPFEYSNIKT